MNARPKSSPLLPVSDALARIIASAEVLPGERLLLRAAAGRTLAHDVRSTRTQPPFDASAMDGYAVRASDVAEVPVRLPVVGVSVAGRRYGGTLGPGEAVRIFTGAPLPAGADTIIIQENTRAEDATVTVLQGEKSGRHVRPAGLDFSADEVLLHAGTRLGPRELALAAAMNHAELAVVRKPRVAILATGDELVLPGQIPGPDQIVASNSFAIAAMVEAAGGLPIDLGIAGDSFGALETAFATARAADVDVLVTLGGASVGDADLVQSALVKEGLQLAFWQIAMRPGKPVMHGRLGSMRVLGLPGNPVSSIVCSFLFLRPLLLALQGNPQAANDPTEPARLGADVAANDGRQDHLRSMLRRDDQGWPLVVPLPKQDSSMLRPLAEAGCLLLRPPHAPAARAGEPARIIPFARFAL